MPLSQDVLGFVRGALPAAPARVLEVGAGAGELARELRSAGFQVIAIDPASELPDVQPVALLDLPAPETPFDAAVGVVSLHHLEPLQESCARLAELVRPGGVLVVDEFDVGRLDESAARWWIARRVEAGHEPHEPLALIERMRGHIHLVSDVVAALEPWFAFGEPVRGPYMHRWGLSLDLEGPERAAIDAGEIPRTGFRIVGTRA